MAQSSLRVKPVWEGEAAAHPPELGRGSVQPREAQRIRTAFKQSSPLLLAYFKDFLRGRESLRSGGGGGEGGRGIKIV